MSEYHDGAVMAAERLGLVDVGDELDALSQRAAEETWSYARFAFELLDRQRAMAEQRSQETLLRFASFPYRKTIDDFDFSFQPSVSETLFREFAECAYIREHQNIVLLGPPGTGKTHLAIALGIEATRRRLRVKFTTCSAMITKLEEAKERNTYSRRLNTYSKPSLLIIDEVGFTPLSPQEASLFFEVICRRYERGSIILTSNRSYIDWAEIFSDNDVIATAILDRLLHHSKSFSLKGESYRMKEFKEV